MFKPRLFLIGFLFVSLGCQQLKTRGSISEKKKEPVLGAPKVIEVEDEPNVPEEGEEQPPAKPTLPERPKLALILGPGALRTFGHIGVLEELSKNRIDIHSVAGLEMGALPAALFARKGQGFDVEWQMMKIKQEEFIERTLIGNRIKAQNSETLGRFFQETFGKDSTDSAKLPFYCQTLSLAKPQTSLKTNGTFVSLLQDCLSFPPLYRPRNQAVASVANLQLLLKALKAKGANYFVFVNVIEPSSGPFLEADSEHLPLWALLAEQLNQQAYLFNTVINIRLDGILITDFSQRREMILRGQKAVSPFIKKYLETYR